MQESIQRANQQQENRSQHRNTGRAHPRRKSFEYRERNSGTSLPLSLSLAFPLYFSSSPFPFTFPFNLPILLISLPRSIPSPQASFIFSFPSFRGYERRSKTATVLVPIHRSQVSATVHQIFNLSLQLRPLQRPKHTFQAAAAGGKHQGSPELEL